MLDAHDTPPEALDEDSMWDDSLNDSDAQPFGVDYVRMPPLSPSSVRCVSESGVVQNLRSTHVYLNCNYFRIGFPPFYDHTVEPLPAGSHTHHRLAQGPCRQHTRNTPHYHLSSPHSRPSFPSRFPLPLLPHLDFPSGTHTSYSPHSLQLNYGASFIRLVWPCLNSCCLATYSQTLDL